MLEIDKKKYPKSYKAFNWKNLFDKNNNEIKNKWILINKKGNRFVLNNKCPFHLHNQYMLGCIKTNLTYDFIYAFEDFWAKENPATSLCLTPVGSTFGLSR